MGQPLIGIRLARPMNRLEWAGMQGRRDELVQALTDHSVKHLASQGLRGLVRVSDVEWTRTTGDQGLLRWTANLSGQVGTDVLASLG